MPPSSSPAAAPSPGTWPEAPPPARPGPAPLPWLLAAVLTVMVGGPVAVILARAFTGALHAAPAELALDAAASLHSVELGLAVVAVSILLAAPLAAAVERTAIGRIRGIDVICVVPFMTPPYIASMGWILFAQPNGYLQRLWPATAVLQPLFFSFFGLVLIMSLHLFPVVYLAVRQAVAAVGGRSDEAARVHGLPLRARLLHVWRPPLLRAALAAGVLVFVKAVGEFGTPIVFGGMIHFRLLTTAIYQDVSSWPISFTAAAQLALVLLVASYAAWSLNDAHQRRRAYPLVSGRSAPGAAARRPTAILAAAYVILLLALAIGVPYSVIAATSLVRVLGTGGGWASLTLSHYAALFRPGAQGLGALTTSLALALTAATICLVVGSATAAAVHFGPRRLARYVDFMALLPNTVPDVLVIIGLILFWNAPWLPWTVYDTPWILVVAFVVLFLPYMVTYVRQALGRLAPSIWEAGLLHGGSRLRVAVRIMLPLLGPAMVAGWMLVFAISFRDLVAPMLISPPGLQTISTYIYGQFSQGALPDAMAMAMVTIGVTVGVLALAQRQWTPTSTPAPGRGPRSGPVSR